MKFVLVDTSVWSLAFRKKRPDSHDKKLIEYLTFLIRNHYAIMIGPLNLRCGNARDVSMSYHGIVLFGCLRDNIIHCIMDNRVGD